MNQRPSKSPTVTPAPARERLWSFNLSRWFALVALASIAFLSAVLGVLLNNFVTDRMLLQEASLTHEFAQSLVQMENPLRAYFDNPVHPPAEQIGQSLRQISNMPDVLRTNVYDRHQRVIWSSDQRLIGHTFGPNDELDEALRGRLVVHPDAHDEPEHGKDEHQTLPRSDQMFVEIYAPVTDDSGKRVLGVIEFYKSPRALQSLLAQLRLYITVGAILSGGVLFLALFGLVRRADLTMREQRRQLVDNETLAAIGEMSSVVAHGIRNPLAAIRSSAELLQDSDSKQARSAAVDIVEQSDRLGAWLRELLSYTRELHGEPTPVPLQPLVQHCLEEFGRQMQASNVAGHTDLPSDLPTVRGDAMLLGQVLRSVLANAIEAMSAGGQIIVRGVSLASSGQVMLSVEDSGPGMTDAELVRAGRPFFTTKPHGLGVGLALARRVMERFGGRLEIEGSRGRGTIVRLYLPTA